MVVNVVSVSGQHFYSESGPGVVIQSGVYLASGLFVAGNFTATAQISGQIVSIASGAFVNVSVQMSGQPVDVSGSHVWISGQHVYVESGVGVSIQSGAGVVIQSGIYTIGAGGITSGSIVVSGIVGISGSVSIHSGLIGLTSGEVHILSGLVAVQSGEVHVMSGEVRANISGDHVFVESGVYTASGVGVIINSGVGVIAKPWRIDVDNDAIYTNSGDVIVVGLNYAWNEDQQIWTRINAWGIGTYAHALQTWVVNSGLFVTSPMTSGSVQVSGTVAISGLVGVQSGEIHVMSGSLAISGSVTVISGVITAAVNSGLGALVSGQNTAISGPGGQYPFNPHVDDNIISNGTTAETDVSLLYGYDADDGEWHRIGINHNDTGMVVSLASGAFFSSGIGVLNRTQVSGAVIVSGIIGISGSVSVHSGLIGITSGEVHILSGQVAVYTPPVIWTNVMSGNPAQFTDASGGQSFASGDVISVILKAHNQNSGDVYIGGLSGGHRPFSGAGFLLTPGEAINLDIPQMGFITACATMSGDRVSYIGIL